MLNFTLCLYCPSLSNKISRSKVRFIEIDLIIYLGSFNLFLPFYNFIITVRWVWEGTNYILLVANFQGAVDIFFI